MLVVNQSPLVEYVETMYVSRELSIKHMRHFVFLPSNFWFSSTPSLSMLRLYHHIVCIVHLIYIHWRFFLWLDAGFTVWIKFRTTISVIRNSTLLAFPRTFNFMFVVQNGGCFKTLSLRMLDTVYTCLYDNAYWIVFECDVDVTDGSMVWSWLSKWNEAFLVMIKSL